MAEPDQTVAVDWARSPAPVPYAAAVSIMEERADLIARSELPELIWLVEHPPLLTAGTSARPEDILEPDRFPVHRTGRGGQVTYHGPGQRIAYVMLDVRRRFDGDVRRFVKSLEGWVIATLQPLGVAGDIREGAPGVWVRRSGKEGVEIAKIAALGIRIRRGVSFHGVSLNVAPDLSHYRALVPCGERNAGITSLRELGKAASMKDVDKLLGCTFEERFGPIRDARAPQV